MGNALGDQILVAFAGIEESSTSYAGLKVRIAEEKFESPAYRFDHDQLILFGRLDVEKINVYKVDFEGEERFVLTYQNQAFELDPSQDEHAPLRPLHPLQSRLARLFQKREPVSLEVFSIE